MGLVALPWHTARRAAPGPQKSWVWILALPVVSIWGSIPSSIKWGLEQLWHGCILNEIIKWDKIDAQVVELFNSVHTLPCSTLSVDTDQGCRKSRDKNLDCLTCRPICFPLIPFSQTLMPISLSKDIISNLLDTNRSPFTTNVECVLGWGWLMAVFFCDFPLPSG